MELRDEFEQANRKGRALRAAVPRAAGVRYDRRIGRIVIHLSTGLDLAFSPRDAQGLEDATAADLIEIEISPSGLGIYFPKLDADLYLPALLEGFFGSKKWMAARLGQLGGRSMSRPKRAASRRNGALGGRPLKPKRNAKQQP